MCVCMHVCMHVCIYICMSIYIHILGFHDEFSIQPHIFPLLLIVRAHLQPIWRYC